MRNLALCLVSLAGLMGCEADAPTLELSPFSERPTELYEYKYTSVNITGPVWLFEADGTYVVHGGPVGVVHENARHPAVLIKGAGGDLLDAGDVMATSPDHILALLDTARDFCTQIGFDQTRNHGAAVFSVGRDWYLVDFCRAA